MKEKLKNLIIGAGKVAALYSLCGLFIFGCNVASLTAISIYNDIRILVSLID